MRSYFTRLFDYDRHANHLILDAIANTGNPEKPLKLMSHPLAAQQIWFNRCNNLATEGFVLWPDWPAETLGRMTDENHDKWIGFLTQLDEKDFDRTISYKNLKGEPFENKLSDILAHVINHGTHHRAQAGQQLITAGAGKLPVTDYIFFVR
jgi:uncharacterized damage-inducible protein DinB